MTEIVFPTPVDTEPTEPVPETPVTERLELLTTDEEPTEPVPATPVTETDSTNEPNPAIELSANEPNPNTVKFFL